MSGMGHRSRLGTCSACSRAMRCITVRPKTPRKLAYGRPRTTDRLRSMQVKKKQRCSASNCARVATSKTRQAQEAPPDTNPSSTPRRTTTHAHPAHQYVSATSLPQQYTRRPLSMTPLPWRRHRTPHAPAARTDDAAQQADRPSTEETLASTRASALLCEARLR